MTLRKITIENSVRYVKKDNRSHTEQTWPVSKEKKNNSNNKLSKKLKNSLRT